MRLNVTGFTQRGMPAPDADAERIPVCILVDTSSAMKRWAELLKEASVRMIEAVAEDMKAREKIDLEVITFNMDEQICIRIEFQELYNLIDEAKGKIRPEFTERFNFECRGLTPTAYALSMAVDELLERYAKLKEAKKAPKSPLLFVLTDWLPEVQNDMRAEHDKLLLEQLARIKQLVRENRLYVFAVQIGRVCEEPQTKWEKKHFPEMRKLMQDITGLDNDSRVCAVKDEAELFRFIEFVSRIFRC